MKERNKLQINKYLNEISAKNIKSAMILSSMIQDMESVLFDSSQNYQREVAGIFIPYFNYQKIVTSDAYSFVEFNWQDVWSFLKKIDERPKRITMIHSHPPNVDKMSSTDKNMVLGWRMALGIPIDYYIISDTNGRMKFTKYICDRKDKKIHIKLVEENKIIEMSNYYYIMSVLIYGLSRSSEKID